MKYHTQKIRIPAGDIRLKLLILTPRNAKKEEKRPGILEVHPKV